MLKKSGGGSSPRSILHSKAYKHWMYCFLSELAALLDVPTFRLVASSLHFLFLFTWWATDKGGGSKSSTQQSYRDYSADCFNVGYSNSGGIQAYLGEAADLFDGNVESEEIERLASHCG